MVHIEECSWSGHLFLPE